MTWAIFRSVILLEANSFSLQDGFGPFSDSAGVSDSFAFSSSFSDEESVFESFGDFGDFQSPEDGELTPTTSGSWTFASELEMVNAGLGQVRQEESITSVGDPPESGSRTGNTI